MRVGWFAVLLTMGAIGACGVGSEFPPSLGGDDGTGPGDGGSDADVPSFGPVIAPSDDPSTCDQAAQWQSYVGCDFWPTVTANIVWSIFDFAVVVANAGYAPAQVTVTGPGGTNQSVTVAPNQLAKIYLPWVPALKGTDTDSCGTELPLSASVLAAGAAYHLVSSVPVTVYQFNALEYGPTGGPAGKDWSSCPGSQLCTDTSSPFNGQKVGCYSFTNDSSLLLPSTALTGNYRITSYPGQTATGSDGGALPIMGSFVAITGITDGTHVKVFVSPTGDVVAGAGVAATAASKELDLTLDSGDVAELVSDLGDHFDLSGSLVTADQPIQVISGAPCEYVPEASPACDHLEQSVFPAETLGKQYFVSLPSGPLGRAVGHVVRLYGNVDGTTLTYAPQTPAGCPATLDAGQVVDCGVVNFDFEVTGNNEFAVGTFMLGGSIVDPPTPTSGGGLGDPSQSMVASVEQYRTKYVFLAPDDYDVNLIDVIAPAGTELVLDGASVQWGEVAGIADGYDVWRVGILPTNGGAHLLEASAPVGMQVLGYGLYTSYQYPAGLNLKRIAPPPGPTQ